MRYRRSSGFKACLIPSLALRLAHALYALVRAEGLLLLTAVATMPHGTLAKKSNRDWASMTDADWAKIEEHLEEPEDKKEREEAIAAANRKMKNPGFDMDAYQNAKSKEEQQSILRAAAAAKEKPGKGQALGYVFVTVNFPGCCDNTTVDPKRKIVTELGMKWSAQLSATGMATSASVWKDNQLAFQTTHESHVREITEYMQMQPEAAVIRHDLENTYGPAATPEFREQWEREIAEREAAKEAKIQKNKAEMERAKRAKNKRKRKSHQLAKEEV